ncbi:MAG: type II toxin-antitoxin system HicB family antitoxin [Candidatus Absconditabacterales bacterium]
MEIAIKAEKKGFSAHIPELHISTQGENLDELVKNMQEAIELYYEEEKNYNKNLLKNGKLYFNMENLKNAIDHKIIA